MKLTCLRLDVIIVHRWIAPVQKGSYPDSLPLHIVWFIFITISLTFASLIIIINVQKKHGHFQIYKQ